MYDNLRYKQEDNHGAGQWSLSWFFLEALDSTLRAAVRSGCVLCVATDSVCVVCCVLVDVEFCFRFVGFVVVKVCCCVPISVWTRTQLRSWPRGSVRFFAAYDAFEKELLMRLRRSDVVRGSAECLFVCFLNEEPLWSP